MIHFGNAKTKLTACGKPIARRWWVAPVTKESGCIGNLGVYRVVVGVADCPACLEKQKATVGKLARVAQ